MSSSANSSSLVRPPSGSWHNSGPGGRHRNPNMIGGSGGGNQIYGVRPPTGSQHVPFRPPTGSISSAGGGVSGFRPGTGSSSGHQPFRPPTGSVVPGSSAGRIGTGARAPSSYGTQQGVGVALNTQVQVSNRPFSRQGMAGVRTGTAGPRRQVMDRSYILSELQRHIHQLQDEIGTLEEERKQIEQDQTLFRNLDKKRNALQEEIRKSRGLLSDYNFALEMSNSSDGDIDARRLEMELEMVEQENATQQRKIDMIFSQWKKLEEGTESARQSISDMYAMLESQLSSDPLKRDQMIQLRNQDSFLGEEIKRARQELRNLENRQRELEIEIQNDPSKQTMILLSQELQQCQQRRSELMGELDPSTAGGSIEDEKQKILAHVRELKAETESMQKEVFRMEEEIQSMRVRVDGSMDDVSSNSASNFGNDATLMEFVQRDKQLTNFIESFDITKEEEMNKLRKIQNEIVASLESISKHRSIIRNIPSMDQFNEMRRDLVFKQQQTSQAQFTSDRLKNKEFAEVLRELESIENIESKIEVQTRYFTDKMKTMQQEMHKYEDLNSLRTDAQRNRRMLEDQRVMYSDRLERLRTLASQKAAENDALKKKITDNEATRSFDQLGNKIRFMETNLFTLEEYIKTEGAETDYVPLRSECLDKIGEINIHIHHSLGSAPSVSSGQISGSGASTMSNVRSYFDSL